MKIQLNVLSPRSVNAAIRKTKEQKAWIHDCMRRSVERLQVIGVNAAVMYYASATYAGEMDVLVDNHSEVEAFKRGTVYRAVVRATGETVLFIEFGTGIKYENAYQLEHGFFAGSYGSKALQPYGWFYTGTPGRHAPPDTDVAYKHSNSVHTYGNPPNRVMYNTREQVRRLVRQVVMEEFR